MVGGVMSCTQALALSQVRGGHVIMEQEPTAVGPCGRPVWGVEVQRKHEKKARVGGGDPELQKYIRPRGCGGEVVRRRDEVSGF